VYKIINRRKLWATRIADAVGRIVFWPVRLRQPSRSAPESVKSILLIRTAYVGDVVMTLPMLKPLKERFRNARISFLTAPGAAPLLENNPYVDEVICHAPTWFYGKTEKGAYRGLLKKLRQRNFDLIIEARADIRELLAFVAPLKARYKVSYDVGGGGYLLTHVVPYPGLKHKVEFHLDIARYLGCRVEGELDYGIRLTDGEEQRVDEILKTHGACRSFICVHPGGRLLLKRWGEQDCMALYDRLIRETGMPLVIVGSKDECALVSRIAGGMSERPCSLSGKLSLRELVGVLSRATVFVCNDSGPMHIAVAMKTPTVCIFGPSKSMETGPYGPRHRVVEKDFACRAACDESHCRNRDVHACMKAVPVESVFDTVSSVTGSAAPDPGAKALAGGPALEKGHVGAGMVR